MLPPEPRSERPRLSARLHQLRVPVGGLVAFPELGAPRGRRFLGVPPVWLAVAATGRVDCKGGGAAPVLLDHAVCELVALSGHGLVLRAEHVLEGVPSSPHLQGHRKPVEL